MTGSDCVQQRRTADADWGYWKEHFEEHLTNSLDKVEFEDSGETISISLAEVSEVVKKLVSKEQGPLRC